MNDSGDLVAAHLDALAQAGNRLTLLHEGARLAVDGPGERVEAAQVGAAQRPRGLEVARRHRRGRKRTPAARQANPRELLSDVDRHGNSVDVVGVQKMRASP